MELLPFIKGGVEFSEFSKKGGSGFKKHGANKIEGLFKAVEVSLFPSLLTQSNVVVFVGMRIGPLHFF